MPPQIKCLLMGGGGAVGCHKYRCAISKPDFKKLWLKSQPLLELWLSYLISVFSREKNDVSSEFHDVFKFIVAYNMCLVEPFILSSVSVRI